MPKTMEEIDFREKARGYPVGPEVDSLKPKSSFFSPSLFITGSQHKIVFFKQDSFTILNEF